MAYTPDGKWKNPWVNLIGDEFDRDTGRTKLIDSLKQGTSYNPYTDSSEEVTGYQAKTSDPFSTNSFMSGIEEIHNTSFNHDPLASSVSQCVAKDEATGAYTPSESLYGKVGYDFDDRSFLEKGVGLVGSVCDQFIGIQEAGAYNPSGYAANGFGNTNGLFAGFNPAGASERRDCFGNIIHTEGLQDYVEEGGRRYNLDFAGNRTETDAFGNMVAANNDVNGFYASAGWNSESGSWNTGSVQSFYGLGDTGSFYGTTTTPVADAGSIYGPSNIWGSTDTQSSSNIWGTTDSSSTGNFWGGNTTSQSAAVDTSWWGGNNIQATADQRRKEDSYWNNNFQTS
jgi:hypothetical protein